MNLIRWALAVFVIVTPLYGAFSGAEDVDDGASARAYNCHNYDQIVQMLKDLWPNLTFTNGMTLDDQVHGVVLTLSKARDGRLFMDGHSYGHLFFDQAKKGYPCIRTDGVGITISDGDTKIYYVYGKGYLNGVTDDGTVLTFPAPVSAGR